jgi:hypothetical protein
VVAATLKGVKMEVKVKQKQMKVVKAVPHLKLVNDNKLIMYVTSVLW